MQFLVPQNIDLEDKVIGPLTLRQFIYLLVGGMVDYVWYVALPFSFFLIFGLITTIIALVFAFVKVQDQPFQKFIQSFVLYLLKPKIRVWQKDAKKPHIIRANPKPNQEVQPHKIVTKTELTRVAKMLDTHGWDTKSQTDMARRAKSAQVVKPKMTATVQKEPVDILAGGPKPPPPGQTRDIWKQLNKR
jgi:hypothetical protein